MNMQINLSRRKSKGRHFSIDEKLIALAVMKQSPKAYQFLNKNFILPSRSTLNKMVSKLNIETGICPQLFHLINKEVATWNEKKKICSLVFDEMSLDAALTYDDKRDKTNNFFELCEKKYKLRGAIYKWQQPMAFYFCERATSGLEMKIILKEITAAIIGCRLKPVALIYDQGSAFQSALNSLKQETKQEQILSNQEPDGTVTITGANLSIVYDPQHLIKGLRNNFLNKDIIIDGKKSKWQDIVDVYKTDNKHTKSRLLHKLNDQHVIPEKIKKMKLKNCVKVAIVTLCLQLYPMQHNFLIMQMAYQ